MKLVALIFCLFRQLWNAAVDTTGRVITGSTDETSDYWYVFDDGIYGGLPLGFGYLTSKKI